jgi:hypothetical protein
MLSSETPDFWGCSAWKMGLEAKNDFSPTEPVQAENEFLPVELGIVLQEEEMGYFHLVHR